MFTRWYHTSGHIHSTNVIMKNEINKWNNSVVDGEADEVYLTTGGGETTQFVTKFKTQVQVSRKYWSSF